MKSKIVKISACIFFTGFIFTSVAVAQQATNDRPGNSISTQMMQVKVAGDYSYRILPASNNSFGYDIFQNNRLIFHQRAQTFMADDGRIYFPRTEQAQKIVLAAIEKIKKGKLPIFTNEEIRKLVQ